MLRTEEVLKLDRCAPVAKRALTALPAKPELNRSFCMLSLNYSVL